MLKKEIEFKDYKGETRKETFYFNLNESEVMKLEMGETGGLIEKINRIVAAKDAPEIMDVFDDIIDKSFGVISPDGREFVKDEETLRKFKQTEAYNILFMELCTKSGAATDFIENVIPGPSKDIEIVK